MLQSKRKVFLIEKNLRL